MSQAKRPWHAMSVEEVLAALGSDAVAGLTEAEARQRLTAYGPNELQEKPPVSFWERLLDQLKGFVVIILLVAAVISALMGDWIEAAAIMAIVVLNAAIGVIQESKAEEALAALKKMAAPDAHVIRDGRRLTIPARELVPGDIVLLEAGNVIPADVRLIETINLKVDEASLTGESMPVSKRADLVLPPDTPLGDRRNCAFMSTMVTYGRGTGVVVATGMQTEIGLIAEMIQSFEEEVTPLQRKLDDLGRVLGIGSLAICGLVFVIGVLRPLLLGQPVTLQDVADFFMVSVSLAIAAVPEGLPAVVTICLALGMRRMVRRHALIRRLPAVETLGSATIICSDKTGTLTQSEMTATRLWADGVSYEVSGRGYAPEGRFHRDGEAIEPREEAILHQLLLAGLLCNDALLEEAEGGGHRMVGDPTEGALIVAAAKAGLTRKEAEAQFPRVGEIPFDSARKMMTTIHRLEEALPVPVETPYVAMVKGAPDFVLEKSTHLLTAEGIIPLDAARRAEIAEANRAMASQALRVLGLAYRPLEVVEEEPKPETVERDLIFIGLVGMIDPARREVIPAVAKARRAGLRTVMVTGDYADTAAAIAREIGILRPEGRVLSGKELDAMSDEALEAIIDEVDVFARVAPQHKVRIVEALRKKGHIVAMTGDGVNDAPALKRADIGVAMGITGTDVSKQTADMVLTDDNYVSIVSAIEEGRSIYSNIRKFVYYLLSCNLAEIAIIFIATLVGWPVPLTAIQLLWLNLLSDGAPALALGLEQGDPDLMERPPRPPDEPVINREMALGVVVQTVAITATVLIAYWRGLHWEHLSGQQATTTAETMAFVTLVLSELLRAYTARSERYPIFRLGVFSNKWMQYAVGFSVALLLAVVYIPFLRPIFNTVPLTWAHWKLLIPLILIPSIAAELQKWWNFRRQQQG